MVKIEKMSEKHIAQVAEIEESIFSVPWSQKAFKDSLELDNTAFSFHIYDKKFHIYLCYSSFSYF